MMKSMLFINVHDLLMISLHDDQQEKCITAASSSLSEVPRGIFQRIPPLGRLTESQHAPLDISPYNL